MIGFLAAALVAASILDAEARYPEGPLRHESGVLVAEMGADEVVFHDLRGGKRRLWRDEGCGPTAIAPFGKAFAALCHKTGEIVILSAAGQELERFNRVGNPNDASADPQTGAVYFSSPGAFSKAAPARGRLLRLGSGGELSTVATDLWYPNGVYVDAPSRRLFVSEHLARRVLVYDIESDGTLSGGRVFADLDVLLPPSEEPFYAEAGPDGLEFAPSGDLVVALYGEARLAQLTPEGKLRRVIPVAARYVTNLAFLADGSAVVVGAHENRGPDLPGVVVRLPASAFVAP